MAANVKSKPEGYNNVIPYMIIKNAPKAIEFYKSIFGAKEMGRLSMPDGRIGHCELQIGDSRIMLAEESLDRGVKSAQTLGDSPISLCIYADNVDEVYNKAL